MKFAKDAWREEKILQDWEVEFVLPFNKYEERYSCVWNRKKIEPQLASERNSASKTIYSIF